MNFKTNNSFDIALIVLLSLSLLVNSQAADVLEDICLRCICEATSDCDLTKRCTKGNDVCGIFQLTWAYWHDAGQLTVNNESTENQSAFPNCANDPICAVNTVLNYMQIFAQDCNGDGQINCYDYASIHKLGGYGCKGGISGSYATKLDQCLQSYEPKLK
ncbi:invertebrate-type lysozyme 3-like [Eupeodes corollae]|uniref:invertebrate-type lysozyme 3-like n=1 Tax=Eupeodes corollae TaxID=290404 RepID=UPI002491EB59|nr:invertebrate-type lysozyme 3-like [Eupeodes corollae]